MHFAPLLLPLFVASGAAGLINEIVWFQLLALQIGGSSRAMAIVLATFMAGMGLGAWGGPRLVKRSVHPLLACGALELVMAAAGILVPAILAASGDGGGIIEAIRWAGCIALLLVPTLAMGAALPVTARILGPTRRASRWVALLYSANTFGGVVGCLLAGFHLLRLHDTATAAAVAAVLNLAAAAMAFLLAAGHPWFPKNLSEPATGKAWLPQSPLAGIDQGILVATFLSGATALAAEVIWTRLLTLLLGGTTYTFSLILACFLCGMGIGSALVGAVRFPQTWLAWCQAGLVPAIAWGAWSAAAGLPAWPVNPRLAATPWVQIEIDLVRCLVAVLPAAILWGASLPLAVAAVARSCGDISRAAGACLAANTAGAVVGSLAAALVLLPGVGSRSTQQLVLATAAVSAVMAAWQPRQRLLSAGLAGLAAVLLGCLLWPTVPPLSPALVGYGRLAALFGDEPAEFLTVREGTDSTLAVSRSPDGSLNYHNAGKVQASGQPQDMRLQRMLGHLATLVPITPRDVLVIGCGAGVTAGAVSVDEGVERETICEIEAEVPRTAGRFFGSINHGVIGNPKVTLRIDDARHFLRTTTATFDAITSDPFDPWVRGAATLYTKEFFTEARNHLRPGGVITIFVQLYEAGTPAVKSEIATFLEVFPDGLVFGNTNRGLGYDIVLLGSSAPLTIDLDRIDERLSAPQSRLLRESLADIGCDNAADLLSTFVATGTQLQAWLAGAEINRDSNLRLQYLAGLGINAYEQEAIYRDIHAAGSIPEGLFTGSQVRINRLRKLARRNRY